MHFTVIREHREFFRNNHWIDCDGILSPQELKRTNEGVSDVLNRRLGKGKIGSLSLNQSGFDKGYDLWRDSSFLKKIVLNRSFSEIASELLEQKPLRFGYDTFFPSNSTETKYIDFLKNSPTLEEISGIQGVLCGAMLCISGSQDSLDPGVESSLFSKTPGNAVFFSPSWPLPLSQIHQMHGFNYLLIVYVKSNAVYIAQQGDPHLHLMKELGYNFGDRLKEPFHPIVYS